MISSTPTKNESLSLLRPRGFNWREIGSLARDYKLNFVHGICLPASCSPEKVIDYAKEILLEADLEPVGVVCRTNDAVPLGAVDVATM